MVCVSGGVDSSVTAGLCVRAFGPGNVFALALPEKDSSPESLTYAKLLTEHLGLELHVEPIEAALAAQGCYERRDEAIKRAVPDYGEGWKAKLILDHGLLDSGRLNVYYIHVESPDGKVIKERLGPPEFLQIVAATNIKQRTRMIRGYYHAEALNYAFVGSHNFDEHFLGFSVRYGDIGVDCLPQAKLYKSQVYQVAEHLGLPEVIRAQTPSSDTYSAKQSEEEFFFALPFDLLDKLLYAYNHDVPAAEAAAVVGLEEEQVQRAYRDFEAKIRTTEHMRQPPFFFDE